MICYKYDPNRPLHELARVGHEFTFKADLNEILLTFSNFSALYAPTATVGFFFYSVLRPFQAFSPISRRINRWVGRKPEYPGKFT